MTKFELQYSSPSSSSIITSPHGHRFPTCPQPGQPATFGVRLHRFWRRVTEGLEVSQLWSQFESEARTSYRLYSRDVEAKTPDGLTRRGRQSPRRQGIFLGGV